MYHTPYTYAYPYYPYPVYPSSVYPAYRGMAEQMFQPVQWGMPNQWIQQQQSIPSNQMNQPDIDHELNEERQQGMAGSADHGGQPFVIDIEDATEANNTFRTAIWTGQHLQVTLMSINVGDDIGLELHPDVDQFLRIEDGEGIVQMGDTRENLNFRRRVSEDDAIMVPAGKWHNITNTGDTPLKLYSIYAPPEHPFGTVHRTKADAMAAEARDSLNDNIQD